MRRIWYVVFAVVVFAVFEYQGSCKAQTALNVPVAVGAWKLAAPPDCVKPVPAELLLWRGTAGARQVCRAEYAGPALMKLALYDMPELPGANAFDAEQKFPVQPGKMGFFQGHYFGVVESPDADRAMLDRFVVALEFHLPLGNEFHR